MPTKSMKDYEELFPNIKNPLFCEEVEEDRMAATYPQASYSLFW
jgi:hypothetical protein